MPRQKKAGPSLPSTFHKVCWGPRTRASVEFLSMGLRWPHRALSPLSQGLVVEGSPYPEYCAVLGGPLPSKPQFPAWQRGASNPSLLPGGRVMKGGQGHGAHRGCHHEGLSVVDPRPFTSSALLSLGSCQSPGLSLTAGLELKQPCSCSDR